jgi:hypothetical protein
VAAAALDDIRNWRLTPQSFRLLFRPPTRTIQSEKSPSSARVSVLAGGTDEHALQRDGNADSAQRPRAVSRRRAEGPKVSAPESAFSGPQFLPSRGLVTDWPIRRTLRGSGLVTMTMCRARKLHRSATSLPLACCPDGRRTGPPAGTAPRSRRRRSRPMDRSAIGAHGSRLSTIRRA